MAKNSIEALRKEVLELKEAAAKTEAHKKEQEAKNKLEGGKKAPWWKNWRVKLVAAVVFLMAILGIIWALWPEPSAEELEKERKEQRKKEYLDKFKDY